MGAGKKRQKKVALLVFSKTAADERGKERVDSIWKDLILRATTNKGQTRFRKHPRLQMRKFGNIKTGKNRVTLSRPSKLGEKHNTEQGGADEALSTTTDLSMGGGKLFKPNRRSPIM